MSEQSTALRLAHWLERDGANCQAHIDAAAELRRLSAVEQERDELLEALKALLPGAEAMGWNTDKACAAIAKAEGKV